MKRKFIVISAVAVLAVIALVALIAGASNHPPTAEAGRVEVRESTPKSITIAGSDEDGDSLTYSVVKGPAHGSLSGEAPALTYSPNANFNGSDSFTFKVNDGRADSEPAVVSIDVMPVNDPPKANDDSVTVQEDAPIATVEVLANDTDIDSDRLIVVGATQGDNGSVTINTDNTLTYAPNRNFSGTDMFTYTVSDGKDGTDKATVTVTVSPVNDPPRITSKPTETTRVWASYKYDVNAKDPDPGDSLVYSLTKKPQGMTIDRDTGLIEWRPTSAQAGAYDVTVRAADSNKTRAWDTQSFTVTVTSLSSPLTNTLKAVDCFSQKGADKVSAKDKINVVAAGDDIRHETEPRSYTCYQFSDASIPAGASIISVVVYVEHFEDRSFRDGRLQWSVGTGWPGKPAVWASTNAPVRRGLKNEATDSWDVTSAAGTPDKVNSLQLQVSNNDVSTGRKTSVDSVYAVVRWY